MSAGTAGDRRRQIDEILAADKANTHLKIRSPISGHVIKKYVREGQYVEEGTPLYDVADLSTVWIQAQVYEDDLASCPSAYEHGTAPSATPQGSSVTATTRAFPDEPFHGKLAFIYPHVDEATRTVTVRFELKILATSCGRAARPRVTSDGAAERRAACSRDLGEAIGTAAEMLAEGTRAGVPETLGDRHGQPDDRLSRDIARRVRRGRSRARSADVRTA